MRGLLLGCASLTCVGTHCDDSGSDMDSLFDRSPLEEVSAHDRAYSQAQIARVCLRKLDMSCLGAWTDGWSGASGRFGYDVSVVRRRSAPVEMGSDWFWIRRIWDTSAGSWHSDQWLEDILKAWPMDRYYTESFVADDLENYDANACYSVQEPQMLSLLLGSCSDPVGFFKAEGQLLRVMVCSSQHPARLAAYRAYLVLIGRFCGGNALSHMMDDYDKLVSLNQMSAGCNAGRKGFMDAIIQHSGSNIFAESLWRRTFCAIRDTREVYFGDWAFDIDMCAIHGFDCMLYLKQSLGVLHDWEETEPNTPSGTPYTDNDGSWTPS